VLTSVVRAHRNFEFFWFPGDSLAYTKQMDRAPIAAKPFALGRDALRFIKDIAVENGVVWVACQSVLKSQRLRAPWLRLGRSLVPHDTAVMPANRAYATPRLVWHFETEYAIPMERATENPGGPGRVVAQAPGQDVDTDRGSL